MLFLDYANRWRHFNPTQEPPMLWQMDAHTTKFHSWMKFQAQTAQLEDHRSTWDREPDEYKPRVSNPRKATDTDLLATLKAQLRSAESKLVAIEKKANGGGTTESNNAKKKRLQKERADQRRDEDRRSKDRRDTNDRGNPRTNNDEDK